MGRNQYDISDEDMRALMETLRRNRAKYAEVPATPHQDNKEQIKDLDALVAAGKPTRAQLAEYLEKYPQSALLTSNGILRHGDLG